MELQQIIVLVIVFLCMIWAGLRIFLYFKRIKNNENPCEGCTSVGAKELVVSTLGVLYTNEEDVENVNLSNRIPITPLAALAYMLFVLIYFPCIATLAAIKQESGSWKWALFAAGYTTVLAWCIAFVVYQLGNLII